MSLFSLRKPLHSEDRDEEPTERYEAASEVGGQIQRFSASNPRSGSKIEL